MVIVELLFIWLDHFDLFIASYYGYKISRNISTIFLKYQYKFQSIIIVKSIIKWPPFVISHFLKKFSMFCIHSNLALFEKIWQNSKNSIDPQFTFIIWALVLKITFPDFHNPNSSIDINFMSVYTAFGHSWTLG